MAKPVLVQLHTTIDPDLMAKFKHLCQSATYPISVGTAIKRLMKKSVEEQQLPGEQINGDKALRELIQHYLFDNVNISYLSVHLNSVINRHRGTRTQKRTVKDVALIAKEVIPAPQGVPMYDIAMTRDYFQVILLDYMVSERSLMQIKRTDAGGRSDRVVFLSRLSILADIISSPYFQNVTNDKQTWFDASGVLVKKLPILGQRWRDLMYNQTSMTLSRHPDDRFRIVLYWYLQHYLSRHVTNTVKFSEEKTRISLYQYTSALCSPSDIMVSAVKGIIQQLQDIAKKTTARPN